MASVYETLERPMVETLARMEKRGISFDRQILSLLKPILDIELGWSNEQFGEIMAAFQGAYAIGLLGFGWLIDRFGVKVGYAISITAWSLAAIGHAMVGSIGGFRIARICLGLGEGGNFPSSIKAVAIWFPKMERAFATSIFNAGANVGAIIAPAVVPLIAIHWGWHAAFIAAGVAGLLWLVLWIPFYDAPERQRRVSAAELVFIRSDLDEPQIEQKLSWMTLLASRKAWSFIVAKFMTDPVWWFFLIWLPDYFKKTRHLDLKNSWVHLVTIYSIVTVLSIVGGWATGRLAKAGWSVTRARKTGMLIFALCVVPIVFVSRMGDWSAVMMIGLAGAAHQAWSANLYTTLSDMFPKSAIASLSGLGGMAGSVGGILFPIYSGKLLDQYQAAGNISGGYHLLFLFCGTAYLVAFGIHHLLAPRFELSKIDL